MTGAAARGGARRCEECGATRDGDAAPAATPATPAATPAQEPVPAHAAPAGTHCEWCGAEFPDED
jgi:hypothetical protein